MAETADMPKVRGPGVTRPVADSLKNLVAELGTDKDKLTHGRFTAPFVDEHQFVEAYRGSWLGRKIVDIVPDDMTREWRAWQADEATISGLEAAEKRHGLRAKLAMALRWSRLYGGAALILGASDGEDDPSQPLRLDRVGQGDMRYVHAVTRHKLAPGQIEDDIESENFGQPRTYLLHSAHGHVQFHHSRIIRLIGAARPPTLPDDGWGDSILMAVYQAMLNATTTSTVIASLLYEAKIDVVAVPDLSTHLSTREGKDLLLRRFSVAGMLKSINNMLLLGDGETHTTKQISFTGLPDIHIRFLQEAAGAADIPVSRLMGQAPAGLNATGESDLRMYYDMIASRQNDDLRPALDRIDEILIRSVLGKRPEDIWYRFESLWQITPQQQAEINAKNAQAFGVDVNSGVFDDEQLRRARGNQITETGAYPGWEAIETELEQKRERITFESPEEEKQLGDAAPRTLYVSRKVKNARDIIAWARAQGFKSTLPASELHVTIAFSREPVDWMDMGEAWQEELRVTSGGARLVEPLGDKGAVVLLFNSSDLSWRHREMRERGASWDWPDYQPHVTISYEAGDLDLSKVEPYRGPIVLGPEIFAEVVEDWEKGLKEE